MKHLFTLFLCLASAFTMNAQSVSLFNVDASGFPTIKAKFYAFDAAGVQQRPSASELTISENGIQRSITSVNCPIPSPPKTVSIALSLDVSGSMGYGDFGEIPLNLGKQTVTALCNQIPTPPSEFALQTCNDIAMIIQDFTANKSRILNALPPIKAEGNNDFVEHQLNKLNGLVNVAKYGKHKKVAVLYTDAWWAALRPHELQACLDTCKKYAIEFYAVIYSRKEAQPNGIKASLQQLANQTGGYLYDGITSKTAAEDIARRIQQVVQSGLPCEVEWKSDVACQASNKAVATWKQLSDTAQFTLTSSSAIARLRVNPTGVSFGKRPPYTINDTTITIFAENADFTISRIRLQYGSTDFSFPSTTFPLVIPKNTAHTITLRFTPLDSGLKYASFEILTDKCPAFFSGSGGFLGKKMTTPTLQITAPNGGETFLVGSDTMITWQGISPVDTVQIEYSSDNGVTWNSVSKLASGLSHSWHTIPLPTGTQCLMRIRQRAESELSTSQVSVQTLTGHLQGVHNAAYSPNGTRIVTGSWDSTAKVWDAKSGALLLTLKGHQGIIYDVEYSPNGRTIATASWDKTAKIWDASNGTLLRTLSDHKGPVNGLAYSPDGSRLVTVSNDTTAKLWNASTGAPIRTLTGHSSIINGVAYSQDGAYIVTASKDRTAVLWNAATGNIVRTLTHSSSVLCVDFSPDGEHIITGGSDNSLIVWNRISGLIERTLLGHADWVYSVDYSPDAAPRVVTSSNDGTIRLWNILTGATEKTLFGHTSAVYSAAFSPDGTQIVTASWDKTVKIWDVGQNILQEDISDSVFSIVLPVPIGQNADLRECLVGAVKDTLLNSYIQNGGDFPFRVDSIAIEGADAGEFAIVSGIPPFNVPAHAANAVEFRFKPTSTGIKTAQILIYTQHDTLRQTITGLGIAPVIAVSGGVVDFGKVFVNSSKDTFRVVTVINIGSTPLTVSQSRLAGPNLTDFSALSSNSTINLQPGDSANVDLQFSPTSQGRTSSRFLVDFNAFGSPATIMLFGEGIIKPSITATQDVAFDSSCVGTIHTRNAAITNDGADTMQLLAAEWITNSGNTFSTTLTPQILPPDSTLMVAIDFLPTALGVSSCSVRWIADKDTAFTSVSGSTVRCVNKRDTARTTVIAQDITAKAGEKVNLSLKLQKSSGMQLTDAPTDWYARIHYNKSMLFTTQSNYLCNGTTDSCALELTGVYNPKSDELLSIPCIATLGTTDHSSITIDEFRWTNGWILTDVITQNGSITITGTCEDGGIRLFIPSTDSSSLSSRPNPAQDNLQIQYGLREPLTVTLELLTMTGQIVQTILKNQAQAAGQYTLTSDLSVLGNGVYLLRLRTNRNILTTRVDVVK